MGYYPNISAQVWLFVLQYNVERMSFNAPRTELSGKSTPPGRVVCSMCLLGPLVVGRIAHGPRTWGSA
jgi:hypothetical protein